MVTSAFPLSESGGKMPAKCHKGEMLRGFYVACRIRAFSGIFSGSQPRLHEKVFEQFAAQIIAGNLPLPSRGSALGEKRSEKVGNAFFLVIS